MQPWSQSWVAEQGSGDCQSESAGADCELFDNNDNIYDHWVSISPPIPSNERHSLEICLFPFDLLAFCNQTIHSIKMPNSNCNKSSGSLRH